MCPTQSRPSGILGFFFAGCCLTRARQRNEIIHCTLKDNTGKSTSFVVKTMVRFCMLCSAVLKYVFRRATSTPRMRCAVFGTWRNKGLLLTWSKHATLAPTLPLCAILRGFVCSLIALAQMILDAGDIDLSKQAKLWRENYDMDVNRWLPLLVIIVYFVDQLHVRE